MINPEDVIDLASRIMTQKHGEKIRSRQIKAAIEAIVIHVNMDPMDGIEQQRHRGFAEKYGGIINDPAWLLKKFFDSKGITIMDNELEEFRFTLERLIPLPPCQDCGEDGCNRIETVGTTKCFHSSTPVFKGLIGKRIPDQSDITKTNQEHLSFGQRIRLAREQLGLNQYEIAVACGLARNTAVSKYELGQAEPTLENLVKIIKFLNVDAQWLLTGRPLQGKGV